MSSQQQQQQQQRRRGAAVVVATGSGRGRGSQSRTSAPSAKIASASQLWARRKQTSGGGAGLHNHSSSKGDTGGVASSKAGVGLSRSSTERQPQPSLCFDSDDDSSSDDENLSEAGKQCSKEFMQREGARLQSCFSAYLQLYGVEMDSLSTLSPQLQRTLEQIKSTAKETSPCLICLERVRRDAPVWQCCQCSTLFHLICIQSWIQKGTPKESGLGLSRELFPDKPPPQWLCPKCRQGYDFGDAPRQYLCFCGKTPNPPTDPWITPHTCGQVCGKELKPECGHTCKLLCHPGPCPPCPITQKATCYCGAQTVLKRCGNQEFSCGRACGKKLRCGLHYCSSVCHPSSCDEYSPCKETKQRSCRCGRTTEVRLCSEDSFSCGVMCDKQLSCGRHACNGVCHEGSCGPCPLAGSRRCYCGKQGFNIACDEPTPSCGDTCGKLLSCGKHQCEDRCHKGECSLCRASVSKQCRCGQQKKLVQCWQQYKCERKCLVWRNCGRHQCKKKCCPGTDCPPCQEVCGRKLGCGNHKCEAVCHSSPCFPCPITVTISCFCGASQISVPCGMERRTPPPKCGKYCSIPSSCHHQMREPHRCHFPPCLPCNQICGVKLACEHHCTSPCHDPIPHIDVPNKRRGIDPYEGYRRLMPIAESEVKDCPPCMVVVKRTCVGLHEERDVSCSSPIEFSCGSICGAPLSCTNHQCQQTCHMRSEKSPCDECTELCKKPRVGNCKHLCPKPCHPGACPPCTKVSRMKCYCLSKIPVTVFCYQQQDPEELQRALQCGQQCFKKLPNCAHECQEFCHPGPCPLECKRRVTVRCACGLLKQQWQCLKVQQEQKKRGVTLTCLSLLECAAVCQDGKKAAPRQQDLPTERFPPQQTPQKKVANLSKSAEDRNKAKTGSRVLGLFNNPLLWSISLVVTLFFVASFIVFGLQALH